MESYCLKYVQTIENEYDIRGDLEIGQGLPENFADCFIITQTLDFIFDLNKAVENIMKVLKPDGIALITVSGITPISRIDMDEWGIIDPLLIYY